MLAGAVRRHDAATRRRAMAGDGTGDDDDVHARVKYKGVARTADGRWRGFITNKFGRRYGVGDHGTPEEAALAHDRAILAILGAHASPAALNFRAAFSDTGSGSSAGRTRRRAAPRASSPRSCAAPRSTPRSSGSRARLRRPHRPGARARRRRVPPRHPRRRRAAPPQPDAERAAFVAAARNKVHDAAWLRSYLRRRRLVGATFEDDNRWPPVVPPAVADVGDGFAGNELVYLPYGSCHVDEMMI